MLLYSRQGGLRAAFKNHNRKQVFAQMKVCAREELDKRDYDSNRMEMLQNARLTGSMGLYQS